MYTTAVFAIISSAETDAKKRLGSDILPFRLVNHYLHVFRTSIGANKHYPGTKVLKRPPGFKVYRTAPCGGLLVHPCRERHRLGGVWKQGCVCLSRQQSFTRPTYRYLYRYLGTGIDRIHSSTTAAVLTGWDGGYSAREPNAAAQTPGHAEEGLPGSRRPSRGRHRRTLETKRGSP